MKVLRSKECNGRQFGFRVILWSTDLGWSSRGVADEGVWDLNSRLMGF